MVRAGLREGERVWVRAIGGSLERAPRRATVTCTGSSALPTPARYYDVEFDVGDERRLWLGDHNYDVWKRSAIDRLGELA